MTGPSPTRAVVPGDAMLHPVVVGAVLLLMLNDHLLKSVSPGLVTGKLSDLAGLVFFPLLLVSLVEVAQVLIGRFVAPSGRTLIRCLIATGCLFAAVKLLPVAADAYGLVWGVLQAPLRVMTGDPQGPVALVQDPTDLMALPAVAIGWIIGRRRLNAPFLS
jgi:hypothetical protein